VSRFRRLGRIVEEEKELRTNTRFKPAATAAMCLAALLNGCAVSPNMGSFETSSPVAFNFLTDRKIESVWLARFDQVVKAVEGAADDLGLSMLERQLGADAARFRYRDAKAEQFRLVVEQSTVALTSILIEVGEGGSVAMARLFARQIILKLTAAGVFDDSDAEDEEGKLFQNL
jgi:hypothetical protein